MMIQFEHPGYLIALCFPVFWWILLNVWRQKEWHRKKQWNQLIKSNETKKPGLFDKPDYTRFLFLSGLLLVVVALANPQWGSKEEKVKAERSDIYIALDISHSMNGRDVAPSRLEKAKKWLSDFILAQRNNRISILFFAGNAYLQMPLSLDYASALMYVQSVTTAMAPTQGSSMSEAITLAINQQKENDNAQKALILVSDGEDHAGESEEAAEMAAEQGFVLFTVGVGTEEGSEVPMITDEGEDLALEEDGTTAISRLNKEVLQTVATAGNGYFYWLGEEGNILKKINDQLAKIEKQTSEEKIFVAKNSYFWLFTLLAMFCFMLPYFPRVRKKAGLAIFVVLFINLTGGQAQSAHDFLKNGDQLFHKKRFNEAEKQYEEAGKEKPSFRADYNRGNALYEQQRYAEATEAYKKAIDKNPDPALKARAYHNLGNARFRQQQYGESVDAYKKALQHNPSDKETIENLLKARKLWRKQQQEEEKQKKEKQEEKQKNQQPSPEENQANQDQNKPSPSQQGQPEQAENKDKSSNKLSEAEAEKLLDIIGNEDKKVHRKIRRGGQPKKEPTKPW